MDLWKDPTVPKTGWTCLDVEDKNPEEWPSHCVAYEQCQMCGNEKIRFVHIMSHPSHPDNIRAGCMCAGKMTGDIATAKNRETQIRNKAARRAKWMTREWRCSAKGNPFLNVEGKNIVIFQKNRRLQTWGFGIDGEFSPNDYDSSNDAKRAAFDEFWELTNYGNT
jgi:hypothetical protein